MNKKNGSPQSFDYIFKILTIGESGVGKTCILLRYTEHKFVKCHLTTIGIDYKSKIIDLNGKTVKLKIWDTAGQEKFRNLTQQYYKNADGILLVFDLLSRESFEKVGDWMQQIQCNTTADTIPVLLLGNKADCSNREVSNEEAEEKAKSFNMKYFETSALANSNIDEAFEYLAKTIVKMKNINELRVTKSDVGGKETIQIGENGNCKDKDNGKENGNGKKKECCK